MVYVVKKHLHSTPGTKLHQHHCALYKQTSKQAKTANASYYSNPFCVCFPLFLLSFQTFSIDSQIIRGKSRQRPPHHPPSSPTWWRLRMCDRTTTELQTTPANNKYAHSIWKTRRSIFFCDASEHGELRKCCVGSLSLSLFLSLSLCCGADRMGGMLFFFC